MIKAIRHVGIVIKDIKKALHFYCDILGFKVIKQEKLSGEITNKLFSWIYFDFEACYIPLTYIKLVVKRSFYSYYLDDILELYYFHDKDFKNFYSISGFNHIALTVDNIDELYNKLQKEKIECYSEPIKRDNVRLFFARDPFGNLLEFCEELL